MTNYWTLQRSFIKYISYTVWYGGMICELIEKNEKGSLCGFVLNILAFLWRN
jgi:hypothetical protein